MTFLDLAICVTGKDGKLNISKKPQEMFSIYFQYNFQRSHKRCFQALKAWGPLAVPLWDEAIKERSISNIVHCYIVTLLHCTLYIFTFLHCTLYIVEHSLARCSLSIYSDFLAIYCWKWKIYILRAEQVRDLLFKSELDLLCDFAETYFSSTQQSSRHSTEFPQIWKLLSKFKGRSRKYLIWHKMLMDGWSTLDWSALLIAWLGDSYTWLEEFSKFVELLHLFCNF